MRIILAVLAVLLVVLQFQLWQERARLQGLDERLSAQTAANVELKARNDALFAEVQDLREGLDAIEERARAELGLVGEGESFYLIVDPSKVAGSELNRTDPNSEANGNDSDPSNELSNEPSSAQPANASSEQPAIPPAP